MDMGVNDVSSVPHHFPFPSPVPRFSRKFDYAVAPALLVTEYFGLYAARNRGYAKRR